MFLKVQYVINTNKAFLIMGGGGVYVRGGICPGGKCPGEYMSGGNCPGGTCPVFFCPVTMRFIYVHKIKVKKSIKISPILICITNHAYH